MDLLVRAIDGVYVDGFVWFSNFHSNGLYRINITSKELEFVDFFPYENIDSFFLHKRCFSYGRRLIFLPAMSKNISIYDIDSCTFKVVPLKIGIEGETVIDAVLIDSKIIMFPRKCKCEPIIFDVHTEEINIVKGFDNNIDKFIDREKISKFFRISENKGCIYMPLIETDVIGKWNIMTGEFNIYHTNNKKIINVLAKDKKCYFTVREQYGLKVLDTESGEIKEFSCNRDNNINANLYGSLMSFGDYIIASPGYGRYIHVFDDHGLVCEYEMPKVQSENYYFFRDVLVDEKIYFLPMGINTVFTLNRDGHLESFVLTCNKSMMSKYNRCLKERIFKNNILNFENIKFDLNDYLECLN